MLTVIKKGTPPAEIKQRIEKAVKKKSRNHLSKYAGKLKTEINPLRYQKDLRDEWQ